MAITTTAQTLVTDAMKLIGSLAQGEQPTSAEFEDGFNRLNELVDNWATQRLTQQILVRTVFDLVANQQEYTVGTGGDINIARPEFVDDVRLLLTSPSPAEEIGLTPLTDDAWQSVTIKGLTSALPQAWHYSATMPMGTLTFWPIPDNAINDGVIYAPQAFTQFATITTSYTLAPSYARALRLNLAITLAPEFGRPVDPAVLLQASDALGDLKRLNAAMADLAFDPALTPYGRYAWYSIYTDSGW